MRVEGELEKPAHRLGRGALVTVWPLDPPLGGVGMPAPVALDIVYEDSAVIVVNKPAGLTVHPAPGERESTLIAAILAHCPDVGAMADALRPGVVHRLDKETSGVMMVAKHERAQRHLQEQLRQRRVEKRYLGRGGRGAGSPAGDDRRRADDRDPRERRKQAVVEGGRPAQTEYSVLEQFAAAALVECKPISGRTHQIRVHMQAIGHPVVGDGLYGRRSVLIGRQALHAAELAFRHPESGALLRFDAPLPADIDALLSALRRGESPVGPGPAGADSLPPERRVAARGQREWRLTRHRARHIR